MLRRVFHEQYDVAEDGNITIRDKKLITSDSVQNPNDTDAAYRSKGGKKVKGFAVNITETCDEESKPNLITVTAIKVKDDKWKIPVKTKEGKDTYRYFDKTSAERSRQ